MEFNMQALLWLVLLVILLAVEVVTLGLTTIWFAAGALAAFGLAMTGTEFLIQVVVFCIVSGVLLAFMRPIAARRLNKDRIRTNAQSLVGMTAVVTEKIDNVAGTGQAQVNGQYWMARTAQEDEVIPKDARVKIQEISGVKLIVKEEKE